MSDYRRCRNKKKEIVFYNEINLAFHCYLIFLSHYKDNDICIKETCCAKEIEFEVQVLQIRDIFGNLEIKRWFKFAIFFLWITLISRCLIVHYSISILLYFLWPYFLWEIINYNFKNVSTFKVVVNYHCHASGAVMCNIFTRWNWNICNEHFLGYSKNRFSYRFVD